MKRTNEEARRFRRAPVTLEIQYRTAGSFLVSYSQNLSKGGLFLETSEQLPAGEGLIVRFKIPTREEPIEVNAQVMWARPTASAEGGPAGLGLAFDQLELVIGQQIDEVVRGFDGVQLVAVAGDEQAVERLARHLCNILSCTVVRATNADEAIAAFSPRTDLVLLDLDSFGAGLPVIAAARSCDPAIPLVAAVRSDAAQTEAVAVGAAAVLHHPLRHKDLRQTVLELLAKPAKI